MSTTENETTESVEVNPRPENVKQLADLIESLTVFDHDGGAGGYEQAADALWKAAQAAFDYVSRRCGVTGFQASWAALRFYGEVMGVDGPFMVIRASDAVYPQYDIPARVEEFLSESGPWLREQAQAKLAGDMTFVVDAVREHWERLAAEATR